MYNEKEDVLFLTMPIKPSRFSQYGVYLAPIINEVFAEVFRASACFAVNELHSFEMQKSSNQFMQYGRVFGLNVDMVWRDKEFIKELSDYIYEELSNGNIFDKAEKVMRCECLAVDELSENFQKIKDKKMITIKDGKYYCKLCDTEVQEIEDQVLIRKFKKPQIKYAIPNYIEIEMENLITDYMNTQFLVSKKRNTGIVIDWKTRKYNIDIDCAWLYYHKLFAANQIVITATNHQIKQFVQLSMIDSQDKSIVFLALPYLRAAKNMEIESMVATLKDKSKQKLFALFTESVHSKESRFNVGMWKTINDLSGAEADDFYTYIIKKMQAIKPGSPLYERLNVMLSRIDFQRNYREWRNYHGK